jgi:DNA-binding PucR family transcriptional regulator
MSLTVREALSLSVLKDAEVVAGHQGLDNPIRWTHILDHPHVKEWTKGGEVLLTSGLGIYDSIEAQEKYILEAAGKKIAAVFIARDYLLQTTPRMRELADEYGLPLVELPSRIPFVEVTEAILRRLASKSPEAERTYLIDALLAGNLPEDEETMSKLRRLGLEPDGFHIIALAQFAGYVVEQTLNEKQITSLVSLLNRAPRRPVISEKLNGIVAIFPVGSREESSVPFARSLEEIVQTDSGQRPRVGIGRLARKLADFPLSYREGRDSLFVASITDSDRSVFHFNDLGVWRLLLKIEDRSELQRFVDYHLKSLIEHDNQQLTSWVATVETFLAQNGNLRATARALNLHRNTIKYQIENIGRVLGRDLSNPDTRLNLQVALLARKLLAARNK